MNQSSHDSRIDCLIEPGASAEAAEAIDRRISETTSGTMNSAHDIGPYGQVMGTDLVVEDEQSIGRSLQIILSRFRVAVVKVTRGEEAASMRAHDYIAKPFRSRELIARLDAAIRRGRLCNSHGAAITVGDVSLDFSRHQARKRGHPLHLTPTQFKLLHFLMVNLGRALPHAKLLMHVWGPEYGGELEYLRTFVRQLRKKIEDDPAKPRYLLTESHFGYWFNEVT
jgi:DNA-binding response OmpR family regulator